MAEAIVGALGEMALKKGIGIASNVATNVATNVASNVASKVFSNGDTDTNKPTKSRGMFTDAALATAKFVGFDIEQKITDQCITGMLEAISSDFVSYTPLVSLLIRMVNDNPKPTGDEAADIIAWEQFINKYVQELEAVSGKPINEYFDDRFIENFERVAQQDGSFLQSRDGILELLYESPQFSGLAEGFLKVPLENFADHSITIEDRFHHYLPEWILNLGNPGLRIIGDTERQPALNLKGLRVVGIALYDSKDEPERATLNDNPMEQFHGLPRGTDKYGDEYQYNYFGPNNDLPNGEPINLLDAMAKDHDYAYLEFGYNTPGAREADRRMVESMQHAIAVGDINEDSPHDQLDLAQKAILYFGLVSNK